MPLPGNRTGGVSGDTGLGNRLGVAKEDRSRARGQKNVMTGPGRAGSTGAPASLHRFFGALSYRVAAA
jgi:hypothetical protein